MVTADGRALAGVHAMTEQSVLVEVAAGKVTGVVGERAMRTGGGRWRAVSKAGVGPGRTGGAEDMVVAGLGEIVLDPLGET